MKFFRIQVVKIAGLSIVIRRKQILLSIVSVLLLLAVQQLGANGHSFDLVGIDASVTKIEYSLVPDPWSSVSLDTKRIDLGRQGTAEDSLLVRLYGKAPTHTIELRYRYDEAIGTWVYAPPVATKVSQKALPDKEVEIILSPYALLMVTDLSLRHMYTLPAGVGANFSLSFPFHRPLIFSADLELSFVKSNNIWASSFFNVGTGLGIGYRFLLGESFVITPALSYRLYFQTGLNSILEMETPVFMTHHLGLDVAVSYRFATNMSLFVSPRAELLLDGVDSGFLYGLHAGVGFEL